MQHHRHFLLQLKNLDRGIAIQHRLDRVLDSIIGGGPSGAWEPRSALPPASVKVELSDFGRFDPSALESLEILMEQDLSHRSHLSRHFGKEASEI